MKLGKLLKLGGFRQDFLNGNGAVEAKVRAEVAALCARFPLYPGM